MTYPLLTAAVAAPTVVVVPSGPSGADVATAAGACVAATAAIIALIFAAKAARAAGKQVDAAQRQVEATLAQTRRAGELDWDRSRAYVVAYMEINPSVNYIADLVIENLGATSAYGVKLTSDVPMLRTDPSGDPTRQRVTPAEPIPQLVPGQQWRTSWEQAWKYLEEELPMKYVAIVTFTDERGEARESRAVLDWTSFVDRRQMSQDEYRTLVAPLTTIAQNGHKLIKMLWADDEVEEDGADQARDERGQVVSADEAEVRRARATARRRTVRSTLRGLLRGSSR